MAQQWRALVALAEDPGLVPAPHGCSQMSVTPSHQAFSDLLRYQLPMRHIYTHTGKHSYA